MPGDVTLISLDELGKAGKALVEKIAGAGWVLYEPYHVQRMAAAQVAADRIRALGDIETSALAKRALVRLVRQEERKQRNVEQVTAGAIPLLRADAKPHEVEEDWLASLFEHASRVSDAEMQALWSRILAGQVNSPGAFSRRTLQVVSALEKRDAHLVTALCRFVWTIGQDLQPIVHDPSARVYTDTGINFATLVHLDALGIVRFEPAIHLSIEGMPSTFEASYFDTRFSMELHGSRQGSLLVGSVALTSVGKELVHIAGASPVDGFAEYCIGDYWIRLGVTAARLD
jgi:hypothetical protein